MSTAYDTGKCATHGAHFFGTPPHPARLPLPCTAKSLEYNGFPDERFWHDP
jgi:hypothetical protein